MEIKKKVKSIKSEALKKLTPVKTKKPAVKKHIVEEKIDQMMGLPISESPVGAAPARSKSLFPWWGLLSLLLLVVFASALLYNNSQYFKFNFNKLLNTTGLFKLETGEIVEEKTEPFLIKMTIVHNQDNKVMKESIEKYLQNMEMNLKNTKVSATWLDRNDEKAKIIISKLNAKFLPLFVVEENIKKHPQYALFANAVMNKNGLYQFQSEGMEYLKKPEVGTARYLGGKPGQAKVVIMEYASFSCGYCAKVFPMIQSALKTFGKDISFVLKHYNRGGIDIVLGQAVECAADQGKFEQMMANMYLKETEFISAMQKEDPETAVYDQIKAVAKTAGANSDKVVACVKSGKYAETVSKDTSEGLDFGIGGTPSFFFNNTFVGGALEAPAFSKVIEEELNK